MSAIHDEQLAAVAADLRAAITGEVRFDRASRVLYSTDASIYQIEPLGVVLPRAADEIAAAIEIAGRHGLPVLPRGGGSSLAGQAVGAAVVIDTSKYLHRLLAVDPEARTARVEPGLTVGELNRALAPHGLMWGPDPASADRATIGGALGNNASGAHSIRYGMAADNIHRVRAVLADGAWATFEPLDERGWAARSLGTTTAARLHRETAALIAAHAEAVRRDFPRHWRRASGYNLNTLLPEPGRPRNLAQLLVGSEGTLAFIVEATLPLVPTPARTALAVLQFEDLVAALDLVPAILSTPDAPPAAVELLDQMLLDLTRSQPAFAPLLTWVAGRPAAVLAVEFAGTSPRDLETQLDALEHHLQAQGYRGGVLKLLDPTAQQHVWQVRKAGLGLLLSIRGDWKPIAFIEDPAVPPERLGAFVRALTGLVETHDTKMAMYAHASAGCLHYRPLINLKQAGEVAKMAALSVAVCDLVIEFGGVMSGEHGDGLSRSLYNRRLFGEELYGAMRRLKGIWDPEGRFNPGKVVDGPSISDHLRYPPGYQPQTPATLFDWSDYGSLAQAAEQCNGQGACRKHHGGVMCPSYRATLDERDTTRARANALRAALDGRLPQGLDDPAVHEAMGLCLACKACKTECPSEVDVAKMKMEWLYQVHAAGGHRRRLRDFVFGYIHELNTLGSHAAPLVNLAARLPGAGRVQQALGIARERPLPPLHRRHFRRWFEAHTPHPNAGRHGDLLLFADTFMTYNYPEIGIAATRVLEAGGWTVRLAPAVCCGRPLLSKGMLPAARHKAEQVVAALAPFAQADIPIVGCEPSCLLTFRDELPDLLPREPLAQRIGAMSRLFGEFIVEHHSAGHFDATFGPFNTEILFHGHCHEKAIIGAGGSLAALALLPGARVRLIESTCCGMAGSFGFEAEHASISERIARLELLPALEAAPTAAVAVSGVSCRQQIAHVSGRRPRHLAEVLAEALPTP
ncbi:MAG: FAD-binding protein [Ardenticatenaceae bacterium]|nr:FAD-binding protein [Ardenticatenaceae bacterium]